MGVEKKVMPRPLDMEGYHLHAMGYELPLITDCTVDIRNNDRSYRVYGRDGEVSFIELAGGSLSMTALHDLNMKVLADILTQQDPDNTDILQGYYPQDNVFTHVTRHLKTADRKSYQRAEFFPYWHTMLEPVVGAPGSYGTFTQAGICDAPVAFQTNKSDYGVAILTDVVQITSADSYGGVTGKAGNFHWYKPTRIPQGAKNYQYVGKYALSVELQKRGLDNRLTDPERQAKQLKITQNMIQAVNGTALATPVAATGTAGTTPNVTGSNLTAGTYWYRYTALDSNGETLSSPNMGAGLAIAVVNGENTVVLTRVTSAARYNVYRAKKATTPADGEYYYLNTVDDPGTGTTFNYLDHDDTTDAFRSLPTVNTTGQGVGRVFIGPNDLKDTGWNLADTDGKFFAFVHYLYLYQLTSPDVNYVIGESLNTYGRWEIPSDVV